MVQESGADATLMIREIQILDPSKWTQNAKMEDYIEDNKVFSRNIFRRLDASSLAESNRLS